MIKPPKTDVLSVDEIVRTLKLDRGLGFLVRLLDTRVHLLYEQLTGQNDITPRQAGHPDANGTGRAHPGRSQHAGRDDQSHGGSLVTKRNNGSDRRSAEVLLAPAGKAVLFEIVSGAARLQGALLAPLPAEEPGAFHAMHEAH